MTERTDIAINRDDERTILVEDQLEGLFKIMFCPRNPPKHLGLIAITDGSM